MKELFVIRPPRKWRRSIALVFPSTYEASITNLFTHIAYYSLYRSGDTLVDRFTLDNPTAGLQTGLPLSSFDVALVSISYEIDMLNFIRMLIANDINPLKEHRRGGPVIIAGGPPVIANPYPLADVVDAVYVGEGELILDLINDIADERRKTGKSRSRPCSYLSEENSFFTGDPEEGVRKSYVSDLDMAFFPTFQIRAEGVEPVYGEGYYIEVSRGCRWLCTFCLEAHVFHPPRHRSLNRLRELIIEGTENLGVRRVVLYSLSFFDHPEADSLLKWLLNQDLSFSLPSLRFDTLTKSRVGLIREGGQRTLTIAPETVDPELSCSIGKCFKPWLIKELVQEAISLDMNIKLYFMIGFPGEDESVGGGIAEFIKDLITSFKFRRKEQLRITLNPLIPKPKTPMQYFPLIEQKRYVKVVKELRRELARLGVRVNALDWRWGFLQALISLGGREVSKLLVRWGELGGMLGGLRRAIKELGFNYSYVFRRKNLSESFPWDNIRLGLEESIKLRALRFT